MDGQCSQSGAVCRALESSPKRDPRPQGAHSGEGRGLQASDSGCFFLLGTRGWWWPLRRQRQALPQPARPRGWTDLGICPQRGITSVSSPSRSGLLPGALFGMPCTLSSPVRGDADIYIYNSHTLGYQGIGTTLPAGISKSELLTFKILPPWLPKGR